MPKLRELDEVWGRERPRLSERVKNGNAVLEDILDHELLYHAYPELRNVRVVFEALEKGKSGSYSPKMNKITLNKNSQGQETALIHEVQHAIQNVEGFASGASVDYWMDRSNNPKKSYMNTAGEIESRDTASRLHLNTQQRREKMPNVGDENTVFTEEEQESKYDIDPYPTDGVHWCYRTGMVDDADISYLWNTVSDISKRKYHSYIKLSSGEHIVERNGKVFFVDANFRNPKVVSFLVVHRLDLQEQKTLKRLIRNMEGDEIDRDLAISIIGAVAGQERTDEYHMQSYSSYEGTSGGGSRKNGHRHNEKVSGGESRNVNKRSKFQRRTDTVSDAELVAAAERDGIAGELNERRRRLKAGKSLLSTGRIG